MSASIDDHFDDAVDEEIRGYLNPDAPKSFFLYAGAGSGKTESLRRALEHISPDWGERLSLRNQQVAVITYTNAACDEIKQRVKFNPLVDVRTIHSFAWSLIKGRDNDIRKWVAADLLERIGTLHAKQAKAKASKTAEDRNREIASKERRLAGLGGIRRFIYSPTGENRTRDSLSHAEVIAMTSAFLTSKSTLQRLLIDRYPILLIDESQDTLRAFMEAVLVLQEKYAKTFCVGLFGDTMQRIYGHGMKDLDKVIPPTWARPAKRMNHRCPQRVIRLINAIRGEDDQQNEDDQQKQRGRSDKPEGHVRLFLLSSQTSDKFAAEARVVQQMAKITEDQGWSGGSLVQKLILEHHMAAARLGFQDFFDPLYKIEGMRTGLLEGTAPGPAFFCRDVLPVVQALAAGDRFKAAAVIRRSSPLLDRKRLEEAGADQIDAMRAANVATVALYGLFEGGKTPTLDAILQNVAQSNLFEIPEVLAPFIRSDGRGDSAPSGEEEDSESELGAWRQALQVPFDQVEKYDRYVRGASGFDTHQGVKGLEFERVMVIISDSEAHAHFFSFEKLFGAKAKSKADIDHEAAGEETSIDTTRRLFYVTCSRATKSLAIVRYCDGPAAAKEEAVRRGWFEEREVELFS